MAFVRAEKRLEVFDLAVRAFEVVAVAYKEGASRESDRVAVEREEEREERTRGP